MTKVHHSAVCTNDVEGSLRFWRDGIGLVVQMDESFEGDWPTLLRAPSERLRSVFLGDPDDGTAGVIELVDLGAPLPAADQPSTPTQGFLLVSLFVDLERVLGRLAEAELGGEPRRVTVGPGVAMAVVVDPNGVQVELIDAVAERHLNGG